MCYGMVRMCCVVCYNGGPEFDETFVFANKRQILRLLLHMIVCNKNLKTDQILHS